MKGELTTGFGGNSISVRDGASALFRRRWLVLFTFFAVVVGTVVVTWMIPNKYESRMKILVKNQRVDVAITPQATGGAPIGVDAEVSETEINSEIELLTSRDLLTQVAKDAGLGQAGPTSFWKKPIPEADRIEKAATDLSKDLVITPVKKTNVISISYSANSPEVAAAVLKKLGELYLDKHLKLHHPTGASDFFKEKADEYETQLHDSEKQLTNFQQDNNLIVLAQQKDLTLQKTAEAKTKLQESEAAVNEATNRIKRIEQQLSLTPKRIITQSKSIPAQYSAERLNTMMVELQNRRTQLLTKFRPEDRLVREVDEQIRTTREALARAESQTSTEQATDLNPLRQTLETEYSRARLEQTGAQARRDTLAAQLREYEASLRKLEGDTTKHDDLQRQKKEAEENYQLYAKKREEARIADELDRQKITNVSIAEAPAVPRIPSSPNRPLNLVLGVFVAAFLSVGTVFSAEMLGDTIHTPRQLEALTGATVLATVPESKRSMMRGGGKRTQKLESAAVAQLES
jgi:polysaccharide chain length determinant protein (PEP-CTERM system associated)